MKTMILLTAIAALAAHAQPAFAEETVAEKTEEAAKDVKKGAKKTVRSVKDEACEITNGKAHCVGKKMKHKAKNLGDEVKDKTDTD